MRAYLNVGEAEEVGLGWHGLRSLACGEERKGEGREGGGCALHPYIILPAVL